jgi:hypothetical protein
MKRVGNVFAVVCILCLQFTPAHALPSKWTANDHWYEPVVVSAPVTWQAAQDTAAMRGGYLASITSQDEEDFVYGLVSDPSYWNSTAGPWLGGYQTAGSPEPAGGWKWISGESWGYSNWWPDGQPDNAGGGENYLDFEGGPLQNVYPGGWWNDVKVDVNGPRAYVIEWNAQPGSPPLCWPTNGHCYQVVTVPGLITWQEARAAALARGGDLATLTSQEEFDFVYLLASNPAYWNSTSGPWLGGYQTTGSPEPSGGWTWVTGESWTAFDDSKWWPDGQPDNAGGNENYLDFEGGPLQDIYPGGWWNDVKPDVPGPRAYIIEWSDLASPAPRSTWGQIKARFR